MDSNENISTPPTERKKSENNSINKSISKEVIIQTDDTEEEITDAYQVTNSICDDNNKYSGDIEKRILELEDYIVEIVIEIENLNNAQDKIKKVITKLSTELKIAKNKITR